MATTNLNTNVGKLRVIDKRATGLVATSPVSATTYAALRDNAATDTALATADAGYWTQARLDATCVTDKVYALRILNDSAGIS